MACLKTVYKVVRFEVECPYCNTTLRSDRKNSPIYRLSEKDVSDKNYFGDELLCTCSHCKKIFSINTVDWE